MLPELIIYFLPGFLLTLLCFKKLDLVKLCALTIGFSISINIFLMLILITTYLSKTLILLALILISVVLIFLNLKKKKFNIYYLRNLRIKHFHKDTLIALFSRKVNQGYWATIIYKIHKKFFKKNPDDMNKMVNMHDFIVFFPSLWLFLFRNGLQKSFYEMISGIAYRIGVIMGIFDNRSFEDNM